MEKLVGRPAPISFELGEPVVLILPPTLDPLVGHNNKRVLANAGPVRNVPIDREK